MKDPFTFAWGHITFEIDGKNGRSKILDGISGTVQSTKLIAIMGCSGSGKTTFLGAISGRLKNKTGTLCINDDLVSNDYVKSISGYVLQNHIFTDSLTAEEHLEFLCGLQLHQNNSARKDHVKKLLREVNVHGKTLIKLMSGGEKRQLALASELIKDPVILFCDEPTTGLDSYSAISVMERLKNIAESRNKIVFTSIHQPSSHIFDMFDDILLIAHGKMIVQGSKCQVAQFFQEHHFHCPDNFNPADFYIDCLTTHGENIMANGKTIEHTICSGQQRKKMPHKKVEHSRRRFFCDLRWLLWRSFLDIRRNKNTHIMSIFVITILALILSVTYSSITINDKNNIQNIQGLLFSMATELIYPNMYSVINVFPDEITVFLKEKDLYSPYPYFLSKFLSLIPICLLGSVIYSVIFFIILQVFHGFVFWMKMTYLLFLMSMVSCCFGLAFSALLSRVEYVDLIFGNTEFFLVLFSGFWIKLGSLSAFLVWIKYLSPFFYAFESLTALFWMDLGINDNECMMVNSTCLNTGEQVLNEYGISRDHDVIIYDIICVHGLILFFCLLGFAGILRKRMIYSVY